MHIFCSFCSKWHTVFKLFVSLFYQYSTRRQRSCFNHRKMGWGRKIQPMGTLKEVLNFPHFTLLVNVWNNQFELLLVYTYFIINFQIKNKKKRTECGKSNSAETQVHLLVAKVIIFCLFVFFSSCCYLSLKSSAILQNLTNTWMLFPGCFNIWCLTWHILVSRLYG